MAVVFWDLGGIMENIYFMKKFDSKRIAAAFAEYDVVAISAMKGKNMEEFYDKVFEMVKKR